MISWLMIVAALSGLSTMTKHRVAVHALSAATTSFRGNFFSVKPVLNRRLTTASGPIKRTAITMMPEGPEVRTLVDQLQGGVGLRLCDIRFLSGRYVHHGKPDGFEEFSKTMTPILDETEASSSPTSESSVDLIQEWNAKGKFIYILLDQGGAKDTDEDFQRSLWITLGMSRRFVSESVYEEDSRHARWYLELLDVDSQQRRKIYYRDMRNFGTVKFCLSANALKKKLEKLLGPDILDPATTEDTLLEVWDKQKPELNVCKFLMNQSKLCGVGNYILAEGLYRAGIDPFASLSEIDQVQQRMLFRELQTVARQSYNAQGMTRKNGSYRDVDGNKGTFEFQLQCYGKEFCSRGKPVRRETNGPHGRTIWYIDDQLFMSRAVRAGEAEINEQKDETDDPFDFIGRSTGEMLRAEKGKGSKKNNSETKEPVANQEIHVKQLVAGLTDGAWKDALSDTIESQAFKDLASFVVKERSQGAVVYPPQDEIFSALNLCPLEDVKVVIVGQDPYHGAGQGHGLAFSVQRGVQQPPSLKNIFKEAIVDVGITPPMHGNLDGWERQGVLLLNSVLTVRKGEANSHSKKGWEEFTDSIIQILNNRKEEGLVFLLFGNPAQNKGKDVDDSKHVIIRTSHPSPLGATKTKSPFLGSKCFSRCNDALREAGKKPIDWNIN